MRSLAHAEADLTCSRDRVDFGLALTQHIAPALHLGVPLLLQRPVRNTVSRFGRSSVVSSRRDWDLSAELTARFRCRWVAIPLFLIYDSSKVILSALERTPGPASKRK